MDAFASPQFLHPVRIYRGMTHDGISEYTYIARPQFGETAERIREAEFWSRDCVGLFVNGPNNIDVVAAQGEFPPFRLVIDGSQRGAYNIPILDVAEGEGEPEYSEGQNMPLPGVE